jgi:hypothetical protein
VLRKTEIVAIVIPIHDFEQYYLYHTEKKCHNITFKLDEDIMIAFISLAHKSFSLGYNNLGESIRKPSQNLVPTKLVWVSILLMHQANTSTLSGRGDNGCG